MPLYLSSNSGNTTGIGPQGPAGPQGAQGPAGATGISGLTYKGAYDELVTYELNDVVTYLGNGYACSAETTGNLPTDTNFWGILVTQGAQGIQGPIGPSGSAGAQGVKGDKGDKGDVGESRVNAPAWVLTNEYVAGDLVTYTDGALYKANGTIAASTAWATGTTGATWWPISEPPLSNTEHLTGKVWIDGKPIYSRTFTGNTGAAGGATTIATITGLTAVVGFSPLAQRNDGLWFPMSNQDNAQIYANSTSILFWTSNSTNWGNRPYRVTVEYTK